MPAINPLITKEIQIPELMIVEASWLADKQNEQPAHLPDITTEQMLAWIGLQYAHTVLRGTGSDDYIPSVISQRHEKAELTMRANSWEFLDQAMVRDCLAIGMTDRAAKQGYGMFFRRAVASELASHATRHLVTI